MWRLRSTIESEVIVEPGEISTPNVVLNIFKVNTTGMPVGDDISQTATYCDITLRYEVLDISEAFAILYDQLNTLLDRVSVVSYGGAMIRKILSVAPASIKLDEEFEMAIPQHSANRTTNSIKLEWLKLGAGVDKIYLRLERLMRLGLNSISEEEKFISYYSLIEEIAKYDSTDYVINTCVKCNNQVNTGRKATNNFIKLLLQQHGVEDKLVKIAPEFRNKIAHGGATKNKEFYATVASLNSHLEEVCLLELEARLGITIVNRLKSHFVDIPIVTHKCVCNKDGSFSVVQSNLIIPARFVILPHKTESVFTGTSAMFGMPLDKNQQPIIDPFAWPDVSGGSLHL